jgi:hypothetical protein
MNPNETPIRDRSGGKSINIRTFELLRFLAPERGTFALE